MAIDKVRSLASRQFEVVRKGEKLSQTEMAELLGVSQSSIQRYESGDTAVPHGIVTKLHEKFGMSYVWYYTNKGPRKDAPVKNNLVTDLASQNSEIEHLKQRVEHLKENLRKLYRDFYVKKEEG